MLQELYYIEERDVRLARSLKRCTVCWIGELTGKYTVDKILHLDEQHRRVNESPERRRAYKQELDREVEAKRQHRKANRERKLKEEEVHARAMEAKFKNNKPLGVEKRPYNALDYEYKALLQKQSHLV